MIRDGENAPGFAEHWASQLGASVHSLERLRGGINNRVFRCSDGNQHWVIKGYAAAEPGQRDRMQAEVDFLRFAAQAAPGFTPVLVHADPARRCVVLEHIEGEPFQEGVAPSAEAVTVAVEFFRRLNSDLKTAKDAIQLDAAEGFLSLSEHLENVRYRLTGLNSDNLDVSLKTRTEALLRRMHCEFEKVEELTQRQINEGRVVDKINPSQRCISPSDFGFHNAIYASERIIFLDFEFAGWDDPAKAAVDFILQPKVQVDAKCYPLLSALPKDSANKVERRCDSLRPILQLKWLCIMLAVLRPERLVSIQLAQPSLDVGLLVGERLDRVSGRLNLMTN